MRSRPAGPAMVRSTISPIGAARPPISSMKASYPVRASITVVCSIGGWPLCASSCSSHWVRPSSVRPSTATGGPARILIQAIGMRTARLAALPCSSRAISFNGMSRSYHPAPPLWSLGRPARLVLPMAEATPDGCDGYASELRREILRSEIQRVQVLAVVLTALLAVTMAVINLLPGPVRADVPGRPGMVGAAGRHRSLCALRVRRPVRAALAGLAGQRLSALCPVRQCLHRDQPAERRHPRPEPAHGADDGLRLLAADALFRVHRAVDLAARFLAVAVDRRCRGRAAVPAGLSGSSRWSRSPARPSTP